MRLTDLDASSREAGAVIRLVIEQHAGVSGLLGAKRRIRTVVPLPTHPQSVVGYRVPSQPPFRIRPVRLGSRRHHNDLYPRPAQHPKRADHIAARPHVPYPARVEGSFGQRTVNVKSNRHTLLSTENFKRRAVKKVCGILYSHG